MDPNTATGTAKGSLPAWDGHVAQGVMVWVSGAE